MRCGDKANWYPISEYCAMPAKGEDGKAFDAGCAYDLPIGPVGAVCPCGGRGRRHPCKVPVCGSVRRLIESRRERRTFGRASQTPWGAMDQARCVWDDASGGCRAVAVGCRRRHHAAWDGRANCAATTPRCRGVPTLPDGASLFRPSLVAAVRFRAVGHSTQCVQVGYKKGCAYQLEQYVVSVIAPVGEQMAMALWVEIVFFTMSLLYFMKRKGGRKRSEGASQGRRGGRTNGPTRPTDNGWMDGGTDRCEPGQLPAGIMRATRQTSQPVLPRSLLLPLPPRRIVRRR